jgi:hypothetical protein
VQFGAVSDWIAPVDWRSYPPIAPFFRCVSNNEKGHPVLFDLYFPTFVRNQSEIQVKQLLKQFLTPVLSVLVIWAGNGYGLLEHACEEHGTHHHLFSNWFHTSCEHEHHEDTADQQAHEAGYTHAHSDAQANFVHIEAETLHKPLSVSSAFSAFFICPSLLSFSFQLREATLEKNPSFILSLIFRRTFGRSLLAWVQAFLI